MIWQLSTGLSHRSEQDSIGTSRTRLFSTPMKSNCLMFAHSEIEDIQLHR
jgi:hypothetical protein